MSLYASCVYAHAKCDMHLTCMNRRNMTQVDDDETLCTCLRFNPWYMIGTSWVCHCGHRDLEHLDGHRSCTGTVVQR